MLLGIGFCLIFCAYQLFNASQTISSSEKLKELWLVFWFALKVKTYRWHRKRSFVIALSGPDRAGKTAMAYRLQDLLRTFALRAPCSWLRPGSSAGLDAIRLPWRWWTRDTDRALVVHNSSDVARSLIHRSFLQRHPLLRSLWGSVLAGDFLMRLWLRFIWAKLTGGIHIFDRYAPDAAVDLMVTYHWAPARWVIKLTPRPKLGVLLWINAEEACKRSASSPLPDGLAKRLTLYQEYQGYYHLKLAGSDAPEHLLEQVAQPILKTYLRGEES